MSTNSASNTQLKAFLQGEKDLKLPFDLVSSNRSGTTKYVCTKVLRILPKKRLVLLAHNGEQQVVIKLFSSASNGQREYEKEITGYDSIVSANVNSPELLEKIPDLDGCFSVIYKYLDEAESFNLDNLTTSNDRITKLLQAVATLHNHGIFQKDIHLDNLLLKNEEIYFIDLGSIKSSQSNQSLKKEKSLKNLALLFAQFFPLQQTKLVNALSTYYQARNWTLNNTSNDQSLDKNDHEKFAIFLSTAWNKRKRNYLSKCFRTCSMTQYKKTFSYEIAFRSNFLDKV
ncbi:MAG: lipopolysaccharide core heptose(II) kinase RfaY, partial [Gammaproteobacteria bacterium]